MHINIYVIMEDIIYGLQPAVSRSGDAVGVMNVSASNVTSGMSGADDAFSAQSLIVPVADSCFQFQSTERDISIPDHMSDQVVKSQIACHPLYPNMVSAYIECQKVGAPPELAMLLEEIGREHHPMPMSSSNDQMGDDPELEEFMESYCEILHKYKEELSRPFNEATSFLSSMESQLSSLCKETLTISLDYRSAAGTSEEESSFGEVDVTDCNDESATRTADQEIKEMLLHKYSGYLSNLRKEFRKKRKKGKLPNDARTMLLHWWNTHYRWPYPTEEEKLQLSELTGLDHKQINNWFINQRKRHWKPSDDMKYALLENVACGNHGSPFYLDIASSSHETDDI